MVRKHQLSWTSRRRTQSCREKRRIFSPVQQVLQWPDQLRTAQYQPSAIYRECPHNSKLWSRSNISVLLLSSGVLLQWIRQDTGRCRMDRCRPNTKKFIGNWNLNKLTKTAKKSKVRHHFDLSGRGTTLKLIIASSNQLHIPQLSKKFKKTGSWFECPFLVFPFVFFPLIGARI
jgi:hypothetical protein